MYNPSNIFMCTIGLNMSHDAPKTVEYQMKFPKWYNPEFAVVFISTKWRLSTVSWLNWNLKLFHFVEEEKAENPVKTRWGKDENSNQQQTQATYDAGSGNRTQATLIGR